MSVEEEKINIPVQEENTQTEEVKKLNPIILKKEFKRPDEEHSKDDDIVFKIRTKLLSTEEHKSFGNHLLEDFKYEEEGTNGLFDSNPKVVRIAGFEWNKKITKKISIINKSKYSERWIILPPSTPFFKIKYSKRGQIPPGLSETIYLIFTPQNYQYYTDRILINCPCSKIIIPIHAYPKMNIHAKEYIPKVIDFGNVVIDTKEKKEICVNNIIDMDFAYEITPVKPLPEITLAPLTGTFQAFNSKKFLVTFTPNRSGIFQAEYELKVNEVDFIPYTFTIYGTCNTYGWTRNYDLPESKPITKKNVSPIRELRWNTQNENKQLSEQKNNWDERDSENEVENDSKGNQNGENNECNEGQIKDDINKSLKFTNASLSQNNQKNDTQISQASRPESKWLQKFKDFPTNKERDYLNYYNEKEDLIQAKGFKYIRFVGSKVLNDDQNKELLDERNNDWHNKQEIKCSNDKNLHSPELDAEACEVDRDIKYYQKPNFNTNQNDNFFKTRHYFKEFLKGVTKVIIRRRADDNLKKLKNMITANNIKTKDDFSKYCVNDWIDFYSKDQQSSNDETSFNFLKMTFIPPAHSFREKVYLANEYSLNSLKQTISHENNINWEEFKEYSPLERNDLEVLNYKPFVSPGLTQFDINVGEKPFRPPCETENWIRGERGDSEMTPWLNLSLYQLSETQKAHLFTKPDELIFNNPSLKKYCTTTGYSECDTDYNLQPRPIKGSYLPISNYQNEIFMKNNLSYLDNDSIHVGKIDSLAVFCDFSLNYSKKKRIKISDQKDLNVKKDEVVDEDNYIYEWNKEDDKAILDMIEKDDEVVVKEREKNKDGTVDAKQEGKVKLENKMQMHKKKWMSTVPTVFEYVNSGIVNPNNKFIL